MAMHPDVAKKLRAEVLEHCGPDGAPTFETVKKMKYSMSISFFSSRSSVHLRSLVRAVINEALRLFPPVPSNSRETRDSGVLMPPSDGTYPESPVPLYIPAQTPVLWFSFLTHRNHTLWGPDADVFDPERWLDERVANYTKTPMMFTPFSAGPRIVSGPLKLILVSHCSRVVMTLCSALVKIMPSMRPHVSLCGCCSNSTRLHLRPSVNRQDPFLRQNGSKEKEDNASKEYGRTPPSLLTSR